MCKYYFYRFYSGWNVTTTRGRRFVVTLIFQLKICLFYSRQTVSSIFNVTKFMPSCHSYLNDCYLDVIVLTKFIVRYYLRAHWYEYNDILLISYIVHDSDHRLLFHSYGEYSFFFYSNIFEMYSLILNVSTLKLFSFCEKHRRILWISYEYSDKNCVICLYYNRFV